MSRDETLLEAGLRLAEEVGASAVISFVDAPGCSGVIQAYRAANTGPAGRVPASLEDLRALLRDRLAAAAGPLALSTEENGVVVGVFHDALLVVALDEVRSRFDLEQFDTIVPRHVMAAALRLALEIGREGREGKPLGTAFIIGDGDAILSISHQLVLNPYLGHPPEVTTILDRANWESVKEFAQLDGMFVIDASGAVIAAGRYLDVDSKSVSLPSGLGGRHRAAAAVTKLLPVVSVIISESGGTVRVFADGLCRLEVRPDLSTVGRCA
jgi:DNA integrity scanning protein DisA with diadenylate cyclase activity